MGRFPLVDKEIVSEEKNKPVLDEQTLAKLLEAAYVLQEHNRELQEMELGLELKRDQIEAAERASSRTLTPPKPQQDRAWPPARDYTFTLAKIVETQHQIQVRHLDLESAMSLVAERLVQMCPCQRRCHWHARRHETPLPRSVRDPDSRRWDRRSDGQGALRAPVFGLARFSAAPMSIPNFLVDTEECRRRGIQSLIAVPVFHDGGVVGGLELYYPNRAGLHRAGCSHLPTHGRIDH